MAMNLLLMGIQGSGKSVQGNLLTNYYHIPWVSTGEIFKENIKQKTALGKMVDPIIRAGNLVPDEITFKLVEDRLKKPDMKEGFILDGFPRNKTQAVLLSKSVVIDAVAYITITDALALQRMSGRRICSGCGKGYHIENMKPKKEGICDACGKPLIQRSDDQPEAIKKRLDTFHRETEPVLNYFKEKVVKINGNQAVEKVFSDIQKALDKKIGKKRKKIN